MYFCTLEALQNAAKYAEANQVAVRLMDQGGELAFTIEDDGMGFDSESTPPGTGLQNMADRLAALGGVVEVRSTPGAGTTVHGHLSVRHQVQGSTPSMATLG